MLLKNLELDGTHQMLVNGSRGIVTRMVPKVAAQDLMCRL
jgi:hypothetical protein